MKRGALIGLALAALVAGCGAAAAPPSPDQRTTAPPAATSYADITPPAGTGTVPLPGTGKPPVLLGDMNTPEQFMLGAMYLEALSAQGYEVNQSRNIGTTAVSQRALAQGSLDVYPQYLNVFLSRVVGTNRRFTSLAAAYATAQRYAARHNLVLLDPTPFSNTPGIAVLSSYAKQHHLHSLAQLSALAPALTLGAPLEWSISPSGLPALEREYGFRPALTANVNIGQQFNALRQGAVDAAYVQTTDGDLASRTFTTLADTKGFYGYGNVVLVASRRAIRREGPAFAATLNRVSALLTTNAIRGLNAEMGLSSLDPEAIAAEVARDFLQAYGVVQLPGWATTTATATTPTGTATTGSGTTGYDSATTGSGTATTGSGTATSGSGTATAGTAATAP